MKKFFLAAILSIFAVAAMAQDRPTYIINAGYQGANLHYNDKESDNKMKPAFRVGVAVDFPVYYFGAGELSIQPGLYYSAKGSKVSNKLYEYNVNLGYIEMPILANVRFGVTQDVNVFVNAGPYLAYGVYSSSSSKLLSKEVGKEGDALDLYKDAFKKDGALKPFDAGIQVGAGAEYKRIMLAVGGQFGLSNINNVAKDDFKTTNSTFFVTLGYRF